MKNEPAMTLAVRVSPLLHNRVMHLTNITGENVSKTLRRIIETALDLIDEGAVDESVVMPQAWKTMANKMKQHKEVGIMGRISELEAQLQLLKKEAEEETK